MRVKKTAVVDVIPAIASVPTDDSAPAPNPIEITSTKAAPTKKRVTQFKEGDKVEYIGTHPSFKKQYGGILTIWELGKGCDLDKCDCLTPDGKVSTWIEYSALQLVDAIESNTGSAELEGDVWA